MIVITGAYGFIGSCLVQHLNLSGRRDIIVVDDFYKNQKAPNLEGKWVRDWIHRDIFLPWFRKTFRDIECVLHLGARTDTTSADKEVFDKLNVRYTQAIWDICAEYGIPLIYASSAATYGNGTHGYSDDHKDIADLCPLNAYGASKQQVDMWVLRQENAPPEWAGLKFFNVFGPNEYHKGRMASVVFHAYRQVSESGKVKLFRSHREEIADGYQKRDFIYVMDVADVCLWLMENDFENGIYNVGTGEARTFLDLANAVFTSAGQEPDIRFIDTPEDIRENYQYFTQAEMSKLRSAGFDRPFTPLEEAVDEYVGKYLIPGRYY